LARILVVDDDSALRRLVTTVLERRHFTVAEAANGGEALAVLSRGDNFDLVITDIIMPEIEGLELMRRIRELHPNSKIMAVSGGGGPLMSYTQLAKELGADEVLAKPFTPTELVAVVERVLAGERQS
jgi:CheY-like chemotaxis protein